MSPAARRLLAAVVPALALGWLWFARPSPLVAVLAATVALAGAAHGWGRVVGRWLEDDRAPVVVAIGWGAGAALLAAAALARTSIPGPGARDAAIVIGLLLGLVWAAGAPADEAPAGGEGWTARALALVLATLAIAAAVGASGAPSPSTPDAAPALAALAADVGRAAAIVVQPAIVEDGWGFALVLALALTVLARRAELARVLVVLLLVTPALAAAGGVRWTAAACTLAMVATATRAARRRRSWPVLAGLALAIAAGAPPDVVASALGVGVGLAAWACGRALADDEGVAAAAVGRLRPRAVIAVVAALLAVFAVAGARVPVGRRAPSLQGRLERDLDAAAALVHARRISARADR